MGVSTRSRTRFKLALVPALATAALLLPPWALAPLALLNLGLLLGQPQGVKALSQLSRLVVVQLLLILSLYLIRFGPDSWPDALLLCLRMTLMLVPGLWFFLSTPGHHTLAAIRGWMSDRNALILGASLSQIPLIADEAKELYLLQRLRGAPISSGDLWRPAAWKALATQVLLPLLIRLIRLSQLQATALQARGYCDDNPRPMTHYPEE
ncbi:energy-coupling factor transport system permease protein [Ferrimonas sediminum]|uniref:Energy-coupling factor transport system permease protein n=1 Tax=Ferrimonas sediminum TaxID=718193 RepID=A0A1G8JZ80_9GAMM|nr:energy-coupling factor transporter transmembrane component T [Ferrimonas sediminum]SDI36484.1 energy-coupling factor transport system permease protein [Ferrimonas sediminum]